MKADLPEQTLHELKGGTLSTWDAVAMAIAVLSPAMAMAYNTSFAASLRSRSRTKRMVIEALPSEIRA